MIENQAPAQQEEEYIYGIRIEDAHDLHVLAQFGASQKSGDMAVHQSGNRQAHRFGIGRLRAERRTCARKRRSLIRRPQSKVFGRSFSGRVSVIFVSPGTVSSAESSVGRRRFRRSFVTSRVSPTNKIFFSGNRRARLAHKN